MKITIWKPVLGVALSVAMLLPAGSMAQAQNGAPGGRMGGPPGGRMGGRMRGPKGDLERTWRGIGRMQGALSRDQARRIVALVRPWSSKPSMTDAQAQSLNAQLNGVLTAAQKSDLAKRRAGGPGGPGGPGGRDGRGPGGAGGRPPGGFGGPGGGRGGDFDPAKMQAMRARMEGLRKTMNPFYAPSKYAAVKSMPEPMQRGMARRYEETRQTLDALARKAA